MEEANVGGATGRRGNVNKTSVETPVGLRRITSEFHFTIVKTDVTTAFNEMSTALVARQFTASRRSVKTSALPPLPACLEEPAAAYSVLPVSCLFLFFMELPADDCLLYGVDCC